MMHLDPTTKPAFDEQKQIPNEWEMNAIRRAHMLHSQLDAAIGLAAKSDIPELRNMDFLADNSPYMRKLASFYRENLQLARLVDGSDIMFHAHGPAAGGGVPRLGALNWLGQVSDKVMRGIATAWLDMTGQDGGRLSKKMDLRLTGMAPGSLWMGFAVQPTAADLLPQDTEIVNGIRSRIRALVDVGGYIGEEGLMPGLSERVENPAERDMILEALYMLSPTGRVGIHTLGLQTQAQSTNLTNSQRVVLRDVLKTPQDPLKAGVFNGEVRAVDMDKSRIHLHTSNAGVLRCVLQIDKPKAKLIGEQVEISGRYATNKEGRPTLLYADEIRPAPAPKQHTMF